jgi:hypothetical protein
MVSHPATWTRFPRSPFSLLPSYYCKAVAPLRLLPDACTRFRRAASPPPTV